MNKLFQSVRDRIRTAEECCTGCEYHIRFERPLLEALDVAVSALEHNSIEFKLGRDQAPIEEVRDYDHTDKSRIWNALQQDTKKSQDALDVIRKISERHK